MLHEPVARLHQPPLHTRQAVALDPPCCTNCRRRFPRLWSVTLNQSRTSLRQNQSHLRDVLFARNLADQFGIFSQNESGGYSPPRPAGSPRPRSRRYSTFLQSAGTEPRRTNLLIRYKNHLVIKRNLVGKSFFKRLSPDAGDPCLRTPLRGCFRDQSLMGRLCDSGRPAWASSWMRFGFCVHTFLPIPVQTRYPIVAANAWYILCG